MRTLHLVLTLAVLGACVWWEQPRADGGTEYLFPDGGWFGAGDPCSCDELGRELAHEDGSTLHPLLTCAPACVDTRVASCSDAGASVCFGLGCCLWKP